MKCRIGEEIPFAKRGRLGVVHGSVEQHFNPYHLLVETGNLDDLTEESIVQRVRFSYKHLQIPLIIISASKLTDVDTVYFTLPVG